MAERFSRRFGVEPEHPEITIRQDAPSEIRDALLMIAEGEIKLSPGAIRAALCTVLRRVPDGSNWSQYPNIWDECQSLMANAPWYRVYDFVEKLHETLAKSNDPDRADEWQRLVNEHFAEAGVGWKMDEGLLEVRGPEGFELVVADARTALIDAALPRASKEINEALQDLSRRPEPDLTGAIQHAMGAFECVARNVTGNEKATLGEILKGYPGTVPTPLDKALGTLWGYASNVARHVSEGGEPNREEAELMVSIAAASCTYLVSKLGE
jgi:hypothetical protein